VNVPDELRYTEEHEWLQVLDDGKVRVGITDYAQDQLGDVVFVELPEVGAEFATGDMVAEVESTKSVAEVYAPVAGAIVEVNDGLVDTPELVNQSPYGDGWFVVIEPTEAVDGASFLDAEAYRNLIG
jgi:glycine cleavage system H protein